MAFPRNKVEVDFNTEYSALMLAGKALHLAGDKKRYAQRRELLSLRAKLIPVNKNLKQQQESAAEDLDQYRTVLEKVFCVAENDDDDIDTSGDLKERVLKFQTKLCHALHWHEVQVKQIHDMKRYHKQIVNQVLRKELETLRENVAQIKLKQTIDDLQQENEQLKAKSEARIKKQEDEIAVLEQKLKEQKFQQQQLESRDSFSSPVSTRRLVNGLHMPLLPEDEPETPTILKNSKIWTDLKQADEDDAGKLWEATKGSSSSLNGGSSHFGRSLHGSNHYGRSLNGSNHIGRSGHQSVTSAASAEKRKQSFLTSVWGTMMWEDDEDDDEDEFACDTPPSATKKAAPKSMVEYLTGAEAEEEPLSPTSAALRKLADEVFS